MSQETSVVVRKLENYFESAEDSASSGLKPAVAGEPGLVRQLTCVMLMSAAIVLTKLTLLITRWVKRLES